MKKITTLFALIIILGFQNSTAQTKISTDERMDGVWSNSKEKWEIVDQKSDDKTYFEFKDNFTFLTHKTQSITSIYKISLQSYNDKQNYYNFKAVSDAGNEYNMIVDYVNRRIRFIYKDNKENMRLVQHHIKALAYVD
jgi:hypothetical protein